MNRGNGLKKKLEISREIMEGDHSLRDLQALSKLISLKIKEKSLKPAPPVVVDLNLPPQGKEAKHEELKNPAWHYLQGQFRIDFKKLWFMKPDTFDFDSRATVADLIEKFGAGNSPNEHLLDSFLSSNLFNSIPRHELGKAETIFAGTGYLGSGGRSWVRSLYSNADSLDWSSVCLKEKLHSRNFQIVIFNPERSELFV
ncbi:MAG: hypothetical protein M3Q24_02755 [bacterium]|nr:hypothetical protein [bacterium]